jgi:methionyl-tRNA formyltransferase
MSGQRIVFMGTPEFAVRSLDALVSAGIDVAAVVTATDKPAGRGRQVRMPAVKEFALSNGLLVLQPEKLKDPDFHSVLKAVGADLFVVVAFRMLPESIWRMPPLGTINLHASLLPQYRGAAPINWAVINGERITGGTTFFIRHEIDTGDVLMQEQLPIGPDETAGEVHDRLAVMGGRLLATTVGEVLKGRALARPQSVLDAGPLRTAPKLTPENCRIAWNVPVQKVHNLVRGLSPFPGAWTIWTENSRSMHFKVLRTAVTDRPTSDRTVGTVERDEDGLRVACTDRWLRLLEVQAEGKRRMSGAEFARGLHAAENIVLQ